MFPSSASGTTNDKGRLIAAPYYSKVSIPRYLKPQITKKLPITFGTYYSFSYLCRDKQTEKWKE